METTGTISMLLDEELRATTPLDLQSYDAMLHTFEAGTAGIQMTQLARKIVMSKAGLTALIDRLERRDLVVRTRDPLDRRSMRIVLTAQGESVFRAAATVHVEGIRTHFTSHLSEDEARVIAAALERIRLHHVEQRGPATPGRTTSPA